MKTSFDLLDWTFTAFATASLSLTFALHWAFDKKRRVRSGVPQYRPPISVLKPLCGVDEGLYENLVSFVTQLYPKFELILGVADSRDPALTIVARLRRAYPQVELRVVIHGEEDPLANPKVISLSHMARAAKYEHLLISDSNVRAAPDYLSAIAAEMADSKVGLVSNLIVGKGAVSLGAHCENLHLNTLVLATVSLADLADKPCVVGKSMLMRRSQLDELGGFDALRDVLAEDYVLGQRYRAAGYRVVLSRYAIVTYNQRLSMRRFLARHLRWAQLRRNGALGPFLCEPFLYASPFIAPALMVTDGKGSLFCAFALLARVASDGLLCRRATGSWPSLTALVMLPVKDTLLLGVWLIALMRKSVTWRGHQLRITKGSRLIVPTAPLESLSRLYGNANP
jgi:ceramide glucosyltransferase